MSNNSIVLANKLVKNLRMCLRAIARLHLNELDSRNSLLNTSSDQLRFQMQLLSVVITTLSQLYGDI